MEPPPQTYHKIKEKDSNRSEEPRGRHPNINPACNSQKDREGIEDVGNDLAGRGDKTKEI